jgi:hypothetical protein
MEATTMDDDRKTPFFEDRSPPKTQDHVRGFTQQTPEAAAESLKAFQLRNAWTQAQKPTVERPTPEPPPKPEAREKDPPRAAKAIYAFNPGPGMGPTVAGQNGAREAGAYARVRDPEGARAAAEGFTEKMAQAKPETTPEPPRPSAPIVTRRSENGTWADVREARAFPLTSRPAELQALEKGMTAGRRQSYEDAGRYERPADRLKTGLER